MRKIIVYNKKLDVLSLLLNTNIEDGFVIYYRYKDLNPQSSTNYLLLKTYYQLLESFNRKTGLFNHDNIRIQNFNIRIDQILKNYNSFHKATTLLNNYLQYNKDSDNKHISHDPFTCEYCLSNLQINEITIDHYIPQSKDGEDNSSNYKISCFDCNSLKSSIHPIEDKPLYNMFLSYVRDPINKDSKNRLDFYNYLQENNMISEHHYPLLLNSLSLPLLTRIELIYKLLKGNNSLLLENVDKRFISFNMDALPVLDSIYINYLNTIESDMPDIFIK